MDKLFSLKEKRFYFTFISFSLVIFFWSLYRNETCGYDCGLFTVSTVPTVVIAYMLSFWALAVTVSVLLLQFIVRKFGKKQNIR